MVRRDCLLAAAVAAVWGFNFVVIDWGMQGVPPLLFAALRFALVAFPAVLFLPRPEAPWRTVAGVGIFMSLGHFGFLYLAWDERRARRQPGPVGPFPAAGSEGPEHATVDREHHARHEG